MKSRLAWTTVILVLLLTLAWWMYGDDIRCHLVLRDLRHYSATVRRADLDIESKESLLVVIYAIEDCVRAGSHPAYWNDTNEAVLKILATDMEEDDVRLLLFELRRAQAQLYMN